MENITYDQFKEAVLKDSSDPVLVDFYATWCMPCKTMSKILEDAESRLDGKVKIYKVDIDAEKGLADRYGIMSVPTLILFKDKIPYKTLIGVRTMPEIISLVSDN